MKIIIAILLLAATAHAKYEVLGIFQSRHDPKKWVVIVDKNGTQISVEIDDPVSNNLTEAQIDQQIQRAVKLIKQF